MRIWTSWVLANVVGEVVGFGGSALLGVVLARVMAEIDGLFQDTVAVAGVVAVGTFEGACVGVAQSLALKTIVRRIERRPWVLATVAGVVVAWGAGMTVGTRLGDAGMGDEPSWPLLLAGGAGIGVLAGVLLAGPQWLVLRRLLPGSGWWVPAHAIAWALGMLVALVGTSMIDDQTPPAVVAAIGGATGLCMGITVAAVTGIALVWLVRAAGSGPPAAAARAQGLFAALERSSARR